MLPLSFTVSGFSLFLGALALTGWIVASCCCREYMAHETNRPRFYCFWILTFFAVLGVFFAADFLTAFVFFEIMSFTSCVLVLHSETPAALRASDTYLAVAVLGGMATLMGLFLLQNLTGTLTFAALPDACAAVENRTRLYAAGALIFVGFAAKAGLFPLHIWLPTAHPAAPAPASAVLSGVITKCGVFGVLILCTRILPEVQSWGLLLLALCAVTMVLGAVLAIFSNDLKRTFACSSVSQIGFVLTGAAMLCLLGPEHNALAAQGVVLHILNHATIKIILFPCAGIIHLSTHSYDLNDIRGFGRGKPLLALIMGIPMFSLAGVPLLSGYISKTLLHESLVEYRAELTANGATALDTFVGAAEWAFLLAGGLTLAYMLKVFVCIFLQKNANPPHSRAPYVRPISYLPLLLCALALPVFGMLPNWTMAPIAHGAMGFLTPAHAHEVAWFSLVNLKGAAISLAIGIVVYLVVVRGWLTRDGRYVQRWPEKLNLENQIYRPVLLKLLPDLGALAARCLDAIPNLCEHGLRALIFAGGRRTICPPEDDHFARYRASRARTLGKHHTLAYSMAWACGGIVVLCGYLVAVYFLYES